MLRLRLTKRSSPACRESPRSSIQRAEVLTGGFLGPAALSQNRRGLAPEGGPPFLADIERRRVLRGGDANALSARLLSPGFVSGAAVEDGPAGFRARLVTEFTMAAASCPFLSFARRGAPRRECGASRHHAAFAFRHRPRSATASLVNCGRCAPRDASSGLRLLWERQTATFEKV